MRWLDFFSLDFWLGLIDVRLECGGGGPSGETRYNWNENMAPYWQQALSAGWEGSGLSWQPDGQGSGRFTSNYQQYQGPRIAGLNQNQRAAMDEIRHFVGQGGYGPSRSANHMLDATMRGAYLGANPYGTTATTERNAWGHQSVRPGSNPMLGQQYQNPAAGIVNPATGLPNVKPEGGKDELGQPPQVGAPPVFGAAPNPFMNQRTDPGGTYKVPEVSPGGRFDTYALGSGGMYNPAQVQAGYNQYAGEKNPHFRSLLQTGMEDITNAYKEGTQANTTKLMNLAGVFGGGAHQRAEANNQSALGKTLKDYASGMLNTQYDRSASLGEADLARQMQAQQFNVGAGGQAFENAAQRGLGAAQFSQNIANQAFENAAQRGLQAGQFNAGLGNQAFENAAQRGLQAQQTDRGLGANLYENALNRQFQGNEAALGRMFQSGETDVARRFGGHEAAINRGLDAQRFNMGTSSQLEENFLDRQFRANQDALTRNFGGWEAERGRMLGGVPGAQNDQALTFQRLNQLMGVGDIERGLSQDRMNLDYQNWQEAQQHPYRMLDMMTGLLSRAQGGVSPNSTTMQQGYSASPFSQLLGAGLLGYGMFGGR